MPTRPVGTVFHIHQAVRRDTARPSHMLPTPPPRRADQPGRRELAHEFHHPILVVLQPVPHRHGQRTHPRRQPVIAHPVPEGQQIEPLLTHRVTKATAGHLVPGYQASLVKAGEQPLDPPGAPGLPEQFLAELGRHARPLGHRLQQPGPPKGRLPRPIAVGDAVRPNSSRPYPYRPAVAAPNPCCARALCPLQRCRRRRTTPAKPWEHPNSRATRKTTSLCHGSPTTKHRKPG